MKKRIFLLLLIFVFVFSVFNLHTDEVLAWAGVYQSWQYQREITISPATPLDDYQVKIELTTSNFDYSKTKAAGADIRFADDSNIPMEYWIETWNASGTSEIWFKVPNSGTGTVYIYYGNSAATDDTDYDNVFTKDFGESGLTALWHMDDGTPSTTTSDSSGNNHTGTLVAVDWQGSDGGQWDGQSGTQFGSGDNLLFNANADRVYASDSSDWDFGSGDWTVGYWVYHTDVVGSNNAYVMNGTNHFGNNASWYFRRYTNGAINILLSNTGNTWPFSAHGTIVLTTNQWHYVVVTRSGNTISCYIDGQQDTLNNTSYSGTLLSVSDELTIGAEKTTTGSYTNPLLGFMDEVRIYKGRALSADEITAQYERRLYNNPESTATLGSEEPRDKSTTVTATVPSSLIFTVSGVASGNVCANSGGSASVTSTGSTIPFGTYTGAQSKIACQTLTVSTNATDGYVVTVEQDQDLTSAGLDSMNSFSGTYATPTTWSSPPGSGTESYFGFTTDDTGYSDFQTSKYGSFAANDTPYNIAMETDPVADEVNVVSYQLEVTDLQESGTYSNTVMYIATATF